ncbi:hypothetical protein PHSY_007129 [Pseudozyma hubeiensis SY62]|uniref:Uncharacterized protein n=1 Tax=Pseudozyma hubeiensis (strain SY62) TaxID=1305764 RepID=R9PE46_PSEHS|nr:hypothetical protein PHSY_007129 [Pseudozyma hubeiensis SY62]GAC99527.1 hypothetical protein PHSY_007129 [Pseudozyma hubeiensis SY62]
MSGCERICCHHQAADNVRQIDTAPGNGNAEMWWIGAKCHTVRICLAEPLHRLQLSDLTTVTSLSTTTEVMTARFRIIRTSKGVSLHRRRVGCNQCTGAPSTLLLMNDD